MSTTRVMQSGMNTERLKGVGMISGAFGSMFVHVEQQPLYCPRCRCDVHNYMNYVGTTTCTATSGRGSRQERENYHKLYGELLYEVPHYTEGTVRIEPTPREIKGGGK